MLVTQSNINDVLESLRVKDFVSIDTETTGLFPYHGDRLFSIIIGTDEDEYYFDFNTILERSYIRSISECVSNIYMHNAKFDMAFLEAEGFDIRSKFIHCTQAIARIERNDRLSYSLDNLGKEIGYPKSNEVKEYLIKNKLFEWVFYPGKKKREKNLFFEQCPLEVIQPYGERDAKITYKLGEKQREFITKNPKLRELYSRECELTQVLFSMEKLGVLIDRKYCRDAITYEQSRAEKAKQDFKDQTNVDFVDSNKVLEEVHRQNGYRYGKTPKGNPSFTSDNLKKYPNPLAKNILEYRDAYKRAGTYYSNFLFLSDDDSVLHGEFVQSGTATGRMSSRNPNLQNLTKEDEGEGYKVRRAFIPRPDYNFVMIDYDQMEYRLMLDYAGEMGVINQVLDGLDVHTATANLMDVERKFAKTINFMLLYGGGAQKLADALGISLVKAKDLKSLYFRRLPKVQSFIRGVTSKAESRGYVFNKFKRRSYFPNRDFAYKAPNFIIQGGCADIVKKAMIDLYKRLYDLKSRMVCQIHDEILFEVHKDEMSIVSDLKLIMESAYKYKHLPLTCGVEWSDKSWHDKKPFSFVE